MIHQVQSKKTLPEIAQGLSAAAARHSFGVIAVHDLKQTLHQKGVDLAMDCTIFEVCNPRQAKRVLEAEGAVSTALPCRISVYGHNGEFTLATLLPTALMRGFPDASLAQVAEEVEAVLVAMMEEAA